MQDQKETIHSGHFMVSHFEAEEQDDEDDVAVPVPETEVKNSLENIPNQFNLAIVAKNRENGRSNQQLSIETNLSKLFQCMSLAYRQKLTSPKWNRFRGIKLRWKDKIRLNNVIWRCWHMQFIKKKQTLICQFASPLDVDTHNKPEAIVLEGKYWKRKLQAVTAEYKKWRLFYRNQFSGGTLKDAVMTLADREALSWNSQSNDGLMMVDEDYMDFMSDTLFSTISNQPFAFPDSREIAKAGLADFIQPSLGPLQPNLDDFMDTFEPLNEFLTSRLPSVPEEHQPDNIYKPPSLGWDYSELAVNNLQLITPQPISDQYQTEKILPYNNEIIIGLPEENYTIQRNISYPVSHKPPEKKIENPQSQSTLNYQNFVIPMNKETDHLSNSSGYKFPPPIQPNIKFSSQNVMGDYVVLQPQQSSNITSNQPKNDSEQRVMKQDMGAVPRSKFTQQRRQRSRSSTRVDSNQQPQRPPLMSAVSDPMLMNPSSSVLLTQLLTSTNRLRPQTLISDKQNLNSELVKREESTVSRPVTILPVPSTPVTTLIITTPTQHTSTGEQILINSLSASSSNSPRLDSPESPLNSNIRPIILNSPGSKEDSLNGSHKKMGHIHAEQKRRYNIKNGFDMIHSLIPHLNQNPNTKLSKAAMLQKGADYIRQLRSERNQLREEMDSLRQQIECLNTSISNCQSMLPITGAPVSRRRDNKMQEMFDEYVRSRTLENWKFWIFSLMIKPLLESYNNFVSTTNLDDLYRTTIHWVDQHCTLVDLRPVVLNSLRYLCTKTDILTDPNILPQEARQAVMNTKSLYP